MALDSAPPPTAKNRWYRRSWFTILMLVLVAPVGIVLMLAFQPWRPRTKAIVAGLAGLLFLVGLASNSGGSTSTQQAAAGTPPASVPATTAPAISSPAISARSSAGAAPSPDATKAAQAQAINDHLGAANSFVAAKNWDAASKEYQAVLSIDPTNKDALAGAQAVKATATALAPTATPTPLPKAGAIYLDPRVLAGDPEAYKGKNILLQGRALNVDQHPDYTWVNLSAAVRARDTTVPLVVELYPKNPNVLQDECYRFFGIAQGTQDVTRLLTGASNTVPYVRAYAVDPAPAGEYGIGCAAP